MHPGRGQSFGPRCRCGLGRKPEVSVVLYQCGRDGRTLIKDLNCNLVPFANTTNNILFRNPKVIKVERARRASADSEFLLLLCDLDAHVFGGHETSNTFVAFAWVDVGKDEEDFSLVAVRDPPDAQGLGA